MIILIWNIHIYTQIDKKKVSVFSKKIKKQPIKIQINLIFVNTILYKVTDMFNLLIRYGARDVS